MTLPIPLFRRRLTLPGSIRRPACWRAHSGRLAFWRRRSSRCVPATKPTSPACPNARLVWTLRVKRLREMTPVGCNPLIWMGVGALVMLVTLGLGYLRLRGSK